MKETKSGFLFTAFVKPDVPQKLARLIQSLLSVLFILIILHRIRIPPSYSLGITRTHVKYFSS